MTQGIDMTMNRLPARTWNWLRMNGSAIKNISAQGRNEFALNCPEAVLYRRTAEDRIGLLATGMGPDMDRLVTESGVEGDVFDVPAGNECSVPVKLSFSYEDGARQVNRVDICAGADSSSVFILDFAAPAASEGLAAVQVRVRAGKNAQVRLIEVQRLGSGFLHLSDIGAGCGENAALQVVQLELGGEQVYSGCEVGLDGNSSRLEADAGYLGRGGQHLDFNYTARHRGKKTESRMTASGALRDRAFKLFRGTIDFLNGSSGSVGDEREEVLLLGEDVVNQTIPLILCGEEDVQGNHGATIGRLDEELLFYLTSRGVPQEQVCEILSRSRIDALCRNIPDRETVERVENYLNEAVSAK